MIKSWGWSQCFGNINVLCTLSALLYSILLPEQLIILRNYYCIKLKFVHINNGDQIMRIFKLYFLLFFLCHYEYYDYNYCLNLYNLSFLTVYINESLESARSDSFISNTVIEHLHILGAPFYILKLTTIYRSGGA